MAVAVKADRELCPGTFAVPFVVEHLDRRKASGTLVVYVVGNRAPEVQGKLSGEALVLVLPGRSVPVGAVVGPVSVTDPEADRVFFAGLGEVPDYGRVNPSFAGGTLLALYVPSVGEDQACYALGKGDRLSDSFSFLFQDACGATVEVPGVVTIRVLDRIPPTIVAPARNEVVECDGAGNVEEFRNWLERHGGAEALDNCDLPVSWSYELGPFIPGCGKTGKHLVTFYATDPSGNRSAT